MNFPFLRPALISFHFALFAPNAPKRTLYIQFYLFGRLIKRTRFPCFQRMEIFFPDSNIQITIFTVVFPYLISFTLHAFEKS